MLRKEFRDGYKATDDKGKRKWRYNLTLKEDVPAGVEIVPTWP